jgi:hypothetical protein
MRRRVSHNSFLPRLTRADHSANVRLDNNQTKKDEYMNKTMHAVILAFFAGACWFLSLMLKMPLMIAQSGAVMPPFARVCVAYGPPLAAGLAFSALAYCVYVWTRKEGRRANWIGFLATALSALLVVLMPTVVAMYITVADFINGSGIR